MATSRHPDRGISAMRFLGSLLLGIWLVLYGLRGLLHLQFQYDHYVMSALALAAGVLLILRR